MKTNGLIKRQTSDPASNQPSIITSPSQIATSIMSSDAEPIRRASFADSKITSRNSQKTITSSYSELAGGEGNADALGGGGRGVESSVAVSPDDRLRDMGYFTASDARKRRSASDQDVFSAAAASVSSSSLSSFSQGRHHHHDDNRDDNDNNSKSNASSRADLDEAETLGPRYDSSQDSLLSPPSFSVTKIDDSRAEFKPAVLPRKPAKIDKLKPKTQRPLPPEPQCTPTLDSSAPETQCVPASYNTHVELNFAPAASSISETSAEMSPSLLHKAVDSGVDSGKRPSVKDIIRTLQTDSFKDPNYGVPFGFKKGTKMTLKDLDISPPKTQAPPPPALQRRGSKTGRKTFLKILLFS